MPEIKVGVIVDEFFVTDLVWNLIEKSKESNSYSIQCLIVQKLGQDKPSAFSRMLDFVRRKGIVRLFSRMTFELIERVELIAGRFISNGELAPEKHRLTDVDIDKLYLKPMVSSSGYVYRYSNEDLVKIQEKKLDVLIRGGSGILRGKILDICRFGILSFHHADNVVNRGGPPGFWEVYYRQPETGFIIQKLSKELDGGEVLLSGKVPTLPSYVRNQSRIFSKSVVFLHVLLQRLAEQDSLPEPREKTPYSYRLFTSPTLGQQFIYLTRLLVYFCSKALRVLKRQSFRWELAYQFVDDWTDVVLRRSIKLITPDNRFLADPFILTRDGIHYCFFEDFDYKEGKGIISFSEFRKDRVGKVEPVLQEDFHLSFPYVFEVGGEVFMCPETHEANEIRLYKSHSFPFEWKLYKVLMRDVCAVDTIIIPYDGKWWMLTNLDSAKMGELCSELHVFVADAHDSTEWVPHRSNPVIFDSSCARNAGVLRKGNELYRVYQKQGYDVYGESMGVAKIVELSTFGYREELVSEIVPEFFEGIRATHTFSFSNGLLVLDYAKYSRRRR